MADPADRWADNEPGPWYVDRSCILCTLCSELAPDHFRESQDGDHDVVFLQPRSAGERDRCQEALEQCPVGAIGRDADR